MKGRVLKIEHDGIRARATGRLSSDECGNLVSVRLWAAAVGRELRHACSRADDGMDAIYASGRLAAREAAPGVCGPDPHSR